ncbi:tyrosyl-tRNA synthetase [Pseudodesulfovibrio mercurii]|uniref:Tyrosine--tRNA ligase n=1 Tax=Pseudodesulfovibrio mercurii TaxID=641491 RepID=F0JCK9_9BACT|nr:tyrosine--tRNA ligase [Pseudodesulfovibrio mercurii]EGB15689.1 tyrosyl-tRNA synthetase [Pseudodesulfovibrio mercurii]
MLMNELEWRGNIQDMTDAEGIARFLGTRGNGVYAGFDPTAESLHVGNLLVLTTLVRMQRCGLRPIFLLGGATGMIGDPSGKDVERQLIDTTTVAAQAEMIGGQIEAFVRRNTGTAPVLRNNYHWFKDINTMEFLRDVGKHFSVNAMLNKESVRGRIDREGEGISYTEFSYMLLQSFDFLHLFREEGCRMQIGGSDQWGNITSGIDLIRRAAGGRAFGITLPLLTTASGRKFGKSEGNAVFLNAEKTPVYHFHQFWLNTEDRDAIRFLKLFTFLDRTVIAELEAAVEERPHLREAQRRLADEVTCMVHGRTALDAVVGAAQALFGDGDLRAVDMAALRGAVSAAPSLVLGHGVPTDLCSLLVGLGMAQSRGQARRDAQGGGVYVNNRRVRDAAFVPTDADFLDGEMLIVRKGRKIHGVVSRARAA